MDSATSPPLRSSPSPLSTGKVFAPAGTAPRSCERHGPYTTQIFAFDGVPICTPCPACEAEAERIAISERCLKKRANSADPTGIPTRFRTATLEAWRAKTQAQLVVKRIATDFAVDFAERLRDGRSLIFSGNPGTGKTMLACGIARAVLEQGYTVRFAKASDYFFDIKSTWSRDSARDERSVLRGYTEPAMLIVDEMGQSFGTEAERMLFFRLINSRYEEVLPTIIITNTPREGLDAFGEPALDRFKEGGGGCIFFPWESFRK